MNFNPPSSRRRTSSIAWACLIWLSLTVDHVLWSQSRGAIELKFCDEQTEAALNCRVRILSSEGRPQRVRGALFQQGWNLIEGETIYSARPGDYTFQAYHGPQYSGASGGFTLDRKSSAEKVVLLPRHADLSLEGWVGGDLLSYVPAKETLRWLSAEDLSTAVVATDTAQTDQDAPHEILLHAEDRARWTSQQSYVDARSESGLVLHHWLPPAQVPATLPSSRLLVIAKQTEPEVGALPVHAEIGQLWARDVPIWLASGKIDSVQLLGPHLTIDAQRATAVEPTLAVEPERFRGGRRAGRIVEFLYWQLLECGLRIPPSAGSGFGRTSSPLGYNRIYAYAPSAYDPERRAAAWWQAVGAGQSFVTNGPLLRATINGEIPGKVFTSADGESIEADIALTLTVSDPVEYLEVVFNGATLYRARLDEYARQGGKIPVQSIRESGWLMIRVVTERDETYRLATTAPYYFEFAGRPRVSAAAVTYFRDWLEKSAQQIAAQGDPAAAAPYLATARQFWSDRAEQATAP